VEPVPRVRVEAGELARLELEPRQRPGAGLAVAERVVAGELELALDALAAGRVLDQRGIGARLAPAAVEALDEPAPEPQRRLAAGPHEQVHA
jgi:hypothetical protein